MKHNQSIGAETLRLLRLHARKVRSVGLDTTILAEAQESPQPPPEKPRQSLLTTLCTWMFARHGHRRWSLALTAVACLGIALCLIWRQLQPVSVPAAPAAVADLPVNADKQPEDQLRQLLLLRQLGRSADAALLIQSLRQTHPDMDIEQRLLHLKSPE